MTVFACVLCMDARAKTAASSRCSKAVCEVKKQKSRKAEDDRGRESRREATGRSERRDGGLWPASHSSCVSTPHTHKTYTDSIDTKAGIDSDRYYSNMIGQILYFYALSLVRSPLNCVK